jgi:hypothetical protein
VDEANQSVEAVYSRTNLFYTIIQTCDADSVQESKLIYWLEKLDFCRGIQKWTSSTSEEGQELASKANKFLAKYR